MQAFSQFREDPFVEFPLLCYVSTYWPYHLNEAEHHDEVLVRHLAVAFAQGSFELILTEAGSREDEKDFLLANEFRVRCSRSSPCEQCTQLSLRINQALMPCFNVSGMPQLLLLATFCGPRYGSLIIYFAERSLNIDRSPTSDLYLIKGKLFMESNISTWDTRCELVQLYWGYRKPMKADLVRISFRAFITESKHRAISTKHSSPALLRLQASSLEAPPPEIERVQGLYHQYLQEIVQGDLASYVLIAYGDQDSTLLERLLRAVGSLYEALSSAGREVFTIRTLIIHTSINRYLARAPSSSFRNPHYISYL
jgi:hypothetical protein